MNSAGRSCPLCATLVHIGRDTQTLKEPVTRWHRAAWSHLYCRDTIVVLVPHSLSRQCCLFCGPWHHRVICCASPAFTAILLCPHVTSDKTNKILSFVLPRLACFAFFIPPPPSLSSGVSVYQVSAVYVLKDR